MNMNRFLVGMTVLVTALPIMGQALQFELALLVSMELGLLAVYTGGTVERLRRLTPAQLLIVWGLASAVAWGGLAFWSVDGLVMLDVPKRAAKLVTLIFAVWVLVVLVWATWVNLSSEDKTTSTLAGGLVCGVLALWVVGAFAVADDVIYEAWEPTLRSGSVDDLSGDGRWAAMKWVEELADTADISLPVAARAQLFQRVAPAVVLVGNKRVFGTAFIISPSGLAITNHHVVADSGAYVARFRDGRESPVRVVRWSESVDVALLQLDCGGTCPTLKLALNDEPPVGAELMVVGNPADQFLSHTATLGIVSGIREDRGTTFIQTDAAINGGNSGGPMIDSPMGVRLVARTTLRRRDQRCAQGLGAARRTVANGPGALTVRGSTNER
jgi:hypothetical protein